MSETEPFKAVLVGSRRYGKTNAIVDALLAAAECRKLEVSIVDVDLNESGKKRNFIQWKGTNVCMDVNCECGELFHVDGMFAYYVACPVCHAIYKLADTVAMERIDPATAECDPLIGEA